MPLSQDQVNFLLDSGASEERVQQMVQEAGGLLGEGERQPGAEGSPLGSARTGTDFSNFDSSLPTGIGSFGTDPVITQQLANQTTTPITREQVIADSQPQVSGSSVDTTQPQQQGFNEPLALQPALEGGAFQQDPIRLLSVITDGLKAGTVTEANLMNFLQSAFPQASQELLLQYQDAVKTQAAAPGGTSTEGAFSSFSDQAEASGFNDPLNPAGGGGATGFENFVPDTTGDTANRGFFSQDGSLRGFLDLIDAQQAGGQNLNPLQSEVRNSFNADQSSRDAVSQLFARSPELQGSNNQFRGALEQALGSRGEAAAQLGFFDGTGQQEGGRATNFKDTLSSLGIGGIPSITGINEQIAGLFNPGRTFTDPQQDRFNILADPEQNRSVFNLISQPFLDSVPRSFRNAFAEQLQRRFSGFQEDFGQTSLLGAIGQGKSPFSLLGQPGNPVGG